MANLRAVSLSHTFDAGHSWVFTDWNGHFDPHTITTVTGPSGCGKSTLLHCLGGLLTPARGQVLLNEDCLYSQPAARRADTLNRHIGFVFQRACLLPELPVWENIALPHRLRNAPAPHAEIDHWLAVFQLEAFKHARPATLSGGQAHRVAFIRAIINTPDVLLCDEPTGNLDDANTACLLDAMHTLRTNTRCAIVIATHDSRVATLGDATVDLSPRTQ